jgi:hypothetical protein
LRERAKQRERERERTQTQTQRSKGNLPACGSLIEIERDFGFLLFCF